MGRKAAEKPQLLSDKLKNVRLFLGFTQERMYSELRNKGADIHLGYISLFESGERIPSFLVLLAYARVSGIPMEVFVDDKLDLLESAVTFNKRNRIE